MPAKPSPEKDDGNGLLAATRFNAGLIMIIKSYRHIGLFSIFLLRLNQAYVTMIGANGRLARCPKEEADDPRHR
jgi:hypothetical protein